MLTENYHSRFIALCLLALISTIILILVGGVVRVTGNGLGCPDWPLCYGQAIPPILHRGEWVEFSHRLVGLAVSAKIVLLLILAWRHYRAERWVFRTALLLNMFLVVQIVLGGIHVMLEIPPLTGWIHTANAMLIVGLLAVIMAAVLFNVDWRPSVLLALGNRTFLRWISAITALLYLSLLSVSYMVGGDASLQCLPGPVCVLNMAVVRDLAAILSVVCLAAALANVIIAISAFGGRATHLLCSKVVSVCIPWIAAAVYVLLLTGSLVTRSGASLVCTGFPLCGPTPAGMGTLINIQLLHRYTAYVVTALLLLTVYWLTTIDFVREISRFCTGLTLMLVLQLSLGAANIMLKLPMWSRALHLTVGASIWAAMMMISVAVILGRRQVHSNRN